MFSKELTAAALKPIMLALLAQGETYGYRLLQRIEHLSGGDIQSTAGTLYPVLHRLETQGLVASFWRLEEGRNRKYYRITAEGRQVLAAERHHWLRVQALLSQLWEPGPAPA